MSLHFATVNPSRILPTLKKKPAGLATNHCSSGSAGLVWAGWVEPRVGMIGTCQVELKNGGIYQPFRNGGAISLSYGQQMSTWRESSWPEKISFTKGEGGEFDPPIYHPISINPSTKGKRVGDWYFQLPKLASLLEIWISTSTKHAQSTHLTMRGCMGNDTSLL